MDYTSQAGFMSVVVTQKPMEKLHLKKKNLAAYFSKKGGEL